MFNKYKTGREEESWGGPSHSGDNSSFPQEFSLTAAAAAAATAHREQGPGPTVCSVLHWFWCLQCSALVLHWCWQCSALALVLAVFCTGSALVLVASCADGGAAECRAVSFSPISSALSDSGAGMRHRQLTLYTGDTQGSISPPLQ